MADVTGDRHGTEDSPAEHRDHAGGDHPGHPHDHGHDHTGGVLGLLRSVFAPHSHDAGDTVDRELEASHEGMRALKLSLVGLAVTAGLQLVIVAISGSVALLADTVHNFADALTAVPLAFAFWIGRRAPTRRYTYGYGRAEDLAGLFIVLMIALSAGVAGWEAVRRLLDPAPVRNVGWVLAAGVIGFAGNELVAVYRIRVGRRIGSAALVADGLHARTDGLTSLGVVVSAIGIWLGVPSADPVVGLVITAAILVVLVQACRDVYRRLMDSVDPDLVDRVEAVLAAVEGVEHVESVRVRWIGHELHAEADITVDGDLSVADAHAIANRSHHELLHEVQRLRHATIHVNPDVSDGRDHHEATAHHFDRG
jgi:cation diffusion facilitator family transporter